MKGDTKIIMILVALILIGFATYIAYRILNVSKIGTEKIEATSKEAYNDVEITDLEIACKAWLYGDLLSPKKILKEYGLIDAMEPFCKDTNWFQNFKFTVEAKYKKGERLNNNDINVKKARQYCNKAITASETCKSSGLDYTKCFVEKARCS